MAILLNLSKQSCPPYLVVKTGQSDFIILMFVSRAELKVVALVMRSLCLAVVKSR